MTDQVTWTHEIPLLNNYYMVMDVLFVILFGGGGLGVLLFLIMGPDNIFAILKLVTVTTGILIVLAFATMGIVMLNNVEMTFALNEKGVQTVLGKKETRLNKVALFFVFLTGKPGLISTSMLSMYREQTFVDWSDIRKVVMDERKKVISLSSERRLLVRLFCTPETYKDAVKMVETMLPDTDLKRF